MNYSAYSIHTVTLAEILSFNWIPKTGIPDLSIMFQFFVLSFSFTLKDIFFCADTVKGSYAGCSNMFFIVFICTKEESPLPPSFLRNHYFLQKMF